MSFKSALGCLSAEREWSGAPEDKKKACRKHRVSLQAEKTAELSAVFVKHDIF